MSLAANLRKGSGLQGTSMAAPHVVAALALVASAHPSLRKHPGALLARLEAHAIGYCHLSGPRISDADAYGAGMVNVARP